MWCLRSLPVLLNIMHWVFLVLTDNLFVSQYFSSASSFAWRPALDSDNMSMSSAHKRQLMVLVLLSLTLSSLLSRIYCKSARNILKSRGLSTQPCLTPLLVLKGDEC